MSSAYPPLDAPASPVWFARTLATGPESQVHLLVCWLRTAYGELEVHLRDNPAHGPQLLSGQLPQVLTQLALQTRLQGAEQPARWVRHATGREFAAQIQAQWDGGVALEAWMQPLDLPWPA